MRAARLHAALVAASVNRPAPPGPPRGILDLPAVCRSWVCWLWVRRPLLGGLGAGGGLGTDWRWWWLGCWRHGDIQPHARDRAIHSNSANNLLGWRSGHYFCPTGLALLCWPGAGGGLVLAGIGIFSPMRGIAPSVAICQLPLSGCAGWSAMD